MKKLHANTLGSYQRKVGQATEELQAIGQENEKEGIRWTKYFMDKFDKQEWENNQWKQDTLKKLRLKKNDYTTTLRNMLQEGLDSVERPIGYQIQSRIRDHYKKIVITLEDSWHRRHVMGFTVTGTPKIDHWEVGRVVLLANDTIDRIESSQDIKTKSGIHLR